MHYHMGKGETIRLVSLLGNIVSGGISGRRYWQDDEYVNLRISKLVA